MKTQDIVQKLWNLCNVLRDDGITYLQYVTELTYLLFLKMTKETGTEEQIPKGYRWDEVVKKDGNELLDFYRKLLIDLGTKGSPLGRRLIIEQAASATGLYSLSISKVNRLAVPLAPAAEQCVIVDRVADYVDRVGSLSASQDSLRRASSGLDRAVLARAFRGELFHEEEGDA